MTIARWPSGQATDSESVRTGSIRVRAANLAPWRNRNAAVCKTAMSRGSTGRGFQHALVDQLDGQPSSKRPYAGSSPVERAIIRQLAPVGCLSPAEITILNWRVGRAVRQRGANASSPSGCTGSIPVLSAIKKADAPSAARRQPPPRFPTRSKAQRQNFERDRRRRSERRKLL
jgi:hypothetical protein